MDRQAESNAIGVGMVIAAGIVASRCEVTAEEVLRAAGVDTPEKAREIGADEYDLELLEAVFREMERRDALRKASDA